MRVRSLFRRLRSAAQRRLLQVKASGSRRPRDFLVYRSIPACTVAGLSLSLSLATAPTNFLTSANVISARTSTVNILYGPSRRIACSSWITCTSGPTLYSFTESSSPYISWLLLRCFVVTYYGHHQFLWTAPSVTFALFECHHSAVILEKVSPSLSLSRHPDLADELSACSHRFLDLAREKPFPRSFLSSLFFFFFCCCSCSAIQNSNPAPSPLI